jgi:hypothetical protein
MKENKQLVFKEFESLLRPPFKVLQEDDICPYGRKAGKLMKNIPVEYYWYLWHKADYKAKVRTNPIAYYILGHLDLFEDITGHLWS